MTRVPCSIDAFLQSRTIDEGWLLGLSLGIDEGWEDGWLLGCDEGDSEGWMLMKCTVRFHMKNEAYKNGIEDVTAMTYH